jgi:biopolymer transport protein ExbD
MAISVSNGGGSRGGFGRRRFGAHSAMAEMNVVPLVDVVLVLLIIFMLTAHVMEFGLEIKVPTVKSTKESNDDFPVISLKSNGRLYLNEAEITLSQIGPEVRRRFQGANQVFFSADENCLWGNMAQVYDALDQAKLGIKVVLKPEEDNR